MSLPDFTPDERYLVNLVKSPKAAGTSNSYMWGYVTGGAIMAGFAAYHESIPMLLTAFAVVCCFRVYEERYQARWLLVWRSIIDKYEAAVLGALETSGSDTSS